MADRKRPDPKKLSERDNAFLSFGKAMAAWPLLESALYVWFEHATLLDMKQAKPIYYSATNFKSRLDLLRAAIRSNAMELDELEFIKSAIKLAIDYNSFRNKLAHGEFTVEGLIIESKHIDRKLAKESAVKRKDLDVASTNFRALADLMWAARDVALGFNELDFTTLG